MPHTSRGLTLYANCFNDTMFCEQNGAQGNQPKKYGCALQCIQTVFATVPNLRINWYCFVCSDVCRGIITRVTSIGIHNIIFCMCSSSGFKVLFLLREAKCLHDPAPGQA